MCDLGWFKYWPRCKCPWKTVNKISIFLSGGKYRVPEFKKMESVSNEVIACAVLGPLSSEPIPLQAEGFRHFVPLTESCRQRLFLSHLPKQRIAVACTCLQSPGPSPDSHQVQEFQSHFDNYDTFELWTMITMNFDNYGVVGTPSRNRRKFINNNIVFWKKNKPQ